MVPDMNNGEIEATCRKVEMPKRATLATMISKTPVTVFQESTSITDVPQRCLLYMCQTQLPPPESLQEEWS